MKKYDNIMQLVCFNNFNNLFLFNFFHFLSKNMHERKLYDQLRNFSLAGMTALVLVFIAGCGDVSGDNRLLEELGGSQPTIQQGDQELQNFLEKLREDLANGANQQNPGAVSEEELKRLIQEILASQGQNPSISTGSPQERDSLEKIIQQLGINFQGGTGTGEGINQSESSPSAPPAVPPQPQSGIPDVVPPPPDASGVIDLRAGKGQQIQGARNDFCVSRSGQIRYVNQPQPGDTYICVRDSNGNLVWMPIKR